MDRQMRCLYRRAKIDRSTRKRRKTKDTLHVSFNTLLEDKARADACCSSVFSDSSYKPLQVSSNALKTILKHADVGAEFIDVLYGIGRPPHAAEYNSNLLSASCAEDGLGGKQSGPR